MNENNPQNIQIILDESLVAIKSGQETFDSILKKYPHLVHELRPALEAALWLSAQQASLEPRPGFIAASRARLVADIKQQNTNAIAGRRLSFLDWTKQIFQRKYALQFALIFILFIGFISSGFVFVEAAYRSIPGDPLFTSKLAVENARLAFEFSDVGHARLEIKYIDHRSYELEQLLLLARYEFVPETVDRFDSQVEHAVISLEQLADSNPDEAMTLTASLDVVVEDQLVMLTAMSKSISPEASSSVQNALAVTQSSSISVNALLQKIIIDTPASSPTLSSQASNTPLPTHTPTSLLVDTTTPTPTTTSTLTSTSTPTPTATSTVLAILPQPTYTATPVELIETEEPTDIPVQPTEVDDTPTPTDSLPTNTPTPDTPDPTDIPEPATSTSTSIPPTATPVPPTPTTDPGDPTDIPKPPNPIEPPDPTAIP